MFLKYCCEGDASRDGPERGNGKYFPVQPPAGPEHARERDRGIYPGQDHFTNRYGCAFSNNSGSNNNLNPKKILLSWFCFSRKLCRNTQRNKADFQRRNGKELQSMPAFKACFQNCAIGALFRNEKKLGAIISKTKL